jgi:hypothetical protein
LSLAHPNISGATRLLHKAQGLFGIVRTCRPRHDTFDIMSRLASESHQLELESHARPGAFRELPMIA